MASFFLPQHPIPPLIRKIRRGFLILLCAGLAGMGGLVEIMAQGPPSGISHITASADPSPGPSSMEHLTSWVALVGLAASFALSILLVRMVRRRRHLESFLRETDQKWRALVENAPDYIMLLDLDGHILFANRGFMGVEKPELIGKSLAGLVAPPFSERLREQFKTVGGHGASAACRVESEGLDRPGSVFELRMGPVRVNQLIVAIAVNSTEITERVNQERALRESESFHRTFFENTPTGIAIQDFSAVEASVNRLREDGIDDLRAYLETHPREVSRLAGSVIMRQVNPAFLSLYQAPDASAILGPLEPMLKSDDRTHFIDQIVAFTGGEDYYEGEARNLDLKGRTLHLIIRKVVVERRQNGLSKVLTCLIDVTPLKKGEKERRILTLQLQQAQKMEAIGTLAGGVAHDFNNILSIILGNVELSLNDMSPEHPAYMNLREIQQASLRARDIVRQLLSLSRKDETFLKPIHLAPLLTEAVKFLRATIPANIDIHTDLSIGNDVVRADATQIHQVMINLFTNASHAMEADGGTLMVRADNVVMVAPLPGAILPIPPGRYLRISVTDSGDGIPETIKGRIFDPYFTTKAAGKGSGMGLAMVHGIMKNCGGGIVLKTPEARGTTFELYFPLAEIPVQVDDAVEAPIPQGSERVLFVDDETMITTLSEKILSRLGYRVVTLNSPIEALARFQADPQAFDLVITDMSMPHMTGDQLVEGIRQLRPEIPVILCTGFSNKITPEKIQALNIGAVITKPVEVRKIAHIVRKLLDRDRTDR